MPSHVPANRDEIFSQDMHNVNSILDGIGRSLNDIEKSKHQFGRSLEQAQK